MSNDYFRFKQFIIYQDRCAFKVGTDGVILGAAADVAGAKQILDVGAGTGLISLMLAQRSDAEIYAIEPDRESFEQLSENLSQCKWKGRVHAGNSDLQNYSPGFKFDLIVSNPPYFSYSLRNPDQRKSSARHNDSLSPADLLQGAARLMEDNGRLQVIMSYAEGNVLIAEAAGYGLFCHDILKIKPLPASEIRRLVLAFSREKRETTERFLTIEQGKRHEFTQDYIDLTKEFYLRL
jgi:tRNA1Val (adenine37-N6)-methyltransferase